MHKARRKTYHIKSAVERGEIIRCVGCKYWRPLSSAGKAGMRACHFSIDTDELRGMPARECYKKDGTRYVPVKRGEGDG